MVFVIKKKENIIYISIAVIVISIIVLSLFFSSRNLTKAYIEDKILLDNWFEDYFERDSGSRTFGFEKWNSYTYRNKNISYPAYVTVTSFKTLFIISENELLDKTVKTILESSNKGLVIDEKTKIYGSRILRNEHRTTFVIYNATELNNESYKKIKIIGEAWNCGISGTSIICIGVAWISNTSLDSLKYDLTFWSDIIDDMKGTFGDNYTDEYGLIFNVKCH